MMLRRIYYLSFGLALSLTIFSMETDAAESTMHTAGEANGNACLACHNTPKVTSILRSFHSKRALDDESHCESCHGAAGEALAPHGDKTIRFGPNTATSVEAQNTICLDCHKKNVTHWQSGAHATADIGCADCHIVHAQRESILTAREQPGRCYRCHPKARAQMSKPYMHPVGAGKMNCGACHDPHGSSTEFELTRPSLNEVCYACHAEKRGPFIFEHPPASEDCSLCHRAHGSNHAALLTKTAHLLCQQCHSQSGHPSVSYSSGGLAGNTPSSFLLASRCMNCHSQIHGSNHPSGITLTR